MTTTQASAAIQIIKAVADAIRDLKEVPSGKLYAVMMDRMDLASYERIIGILKGTGLVREDGQHLLTWIEPK